MQLHRFLCLSNVNVACILGAFIPIFQAPAWHEKTFAISESDLFSSFLYAGFCYFIRNCSCALSFVKATSIFLGGKLTNMMRISGLGLEMRVTSRHIGKSEAASNVVTQSER